MSLVELANQDGRAWSRIGDSYNVTKKPRDLDIRVYATIPFIPMESVPQGGSYEPSFVPKAPSTISSGTYFERGDILVSKITPSFENGKQALIQSLPLPFGYATTEVIPLRPIDRNKHDPRLLFFYLLHPDVRHFVAERMEGSTGRQRVPEGVLLDLLMPDMESKEQKQAADALELIQSAIAAEERAMQNAQALKQSAMRELFTKGLRGEAQKETDIGPIPESWDATKVSESVIPFRFERSKQLPKSAYCSSGHWPIIDQGQTFVAGYTNNEAKIISSEKPLIIFGDHTRIFKFVDFPFALGADGTKPLYATDEFEPKYLYFAFSHLEIPSRGYNRHYTILSEMQIPKPSLDEQREITAILSAIDHKVQLHCQKRAVLEQLFQSLLHKLMTGEIRVSELDPSALAKGDAA